jgi:hypothetical protein
LGCAPVVGKDAKGVETVVDEFIFQFTHSIVMDWMLPGIQPTNRKVRQHSEIHLGECRTKP